MSRAPSWSIRLEELRPGANRFSRSFAPGNFDLSQPELLGPVAVELLVERDGSRLKVSGTVEFRALIGCARCGERFEKGVSEPISLEYLPHQPEVSELRRLAPEELSQLYYHGNEIDLLKVVQDTLILALPIAPVCSPNCRGLCPICGQNLNRGGCGCSLKRPSPWQEALSELKRRLRE